MNGCKSAENWIRLTGNIAPDGMLLRASSLPDTLHGFRGSVRRFHKMSDAASALRSGLIEQGAAIILYPDVNGWTAEETTDYCAAAAESGRDFCTIFDGEQLPPVQGAGAYLWPQRPTPYLERLRDGDMLEYDTAARTINVDLTPEGFRHRMSAQADEPFVIEKLADRTWSILDRYSRMFLLAGDVRALLIDTGFGTADPRPAIAALTDLPYDVVLTHGHWDHVSGIRFLPEAWISPEDIPLVQDVFGGHPPACILKPLRDNQRFELGGRTLQTLSCPGHTPGSIVLLDEANRMLFAGDAVAEGPTYLFMEHCSIEAFAAGLRRLEAYKPKIDKIFPSHRSQVLDPEYITELADCAQSVINGNLPGEGTCISRLNARCQTYRLGRCAIYYQ